MNRQPRWFTETGENHSRWYIDRFRSLAADGEDLDGEARFIDALAHPGSRIMDAGCGPGRTSGALHRRGHTVVGVDVDPDLIEAAREDHPGPAYVVADLATVTSDSGSAVAGPFDVIVCAGNVMVFLAPGTERDVLANLAALTRPGGRLVIGFRRSQEYPIERFDDDIAAVGLGVDQRFATWNLDPFTKDSDFSVTVLRVP